MAQGPWPIWVISLTDSVERRRAVRRQFDVLGLPFAFFDGVDGRKGLPEEFEKLVDRQGTVKCNGFAMSDAEYACALSHQLAYKKIVDEQLPGAIIFEDDVILTGHLRKFYETRSYETAPLIQLFYHDAAVWKIGQRSTPAARLMRIAGIVRMAVGYSISAEAAARMLTHSLPLQAHADWPCDTRRHVGHWVTEPRIVLHPDPRSSHSVIGNDERAGLRPDGFDYSYGYAKGWRRLFSPASWGRLLTRPLKKRQVPGFVPAPGEEAAMIHIALGTLS